MEMLQAALGISPNAVTIGAALFRLARDKNFIQGRRITQVAGVCLYTACRQIRPCRVMLIDFADKLNVCALPFDCLLTTNLLGQCL